MAEITDKDFKSRGRPEKYDWKLWTDGRKWLLIQGEDFQGTTESFRVLVHRKARAAGLKAETSINPKNKAQIVVRFFNPQT